MARRLVLMPVLPSVTVSEAVNFRGSGDSSSALCANFGEGNQAAPAAHAARCRNSRRFMGDLRVMQNRRLHLILDARKAPFVFLLRSEEHTSELQSHVNLVCRLLLE